MSPTVTVIIPVYNGAGKIRRTLRSVLAQGACVGEVICVDDASGDSSWHTLRKEAEKEPRLKVISLEKNAGPLAARMEGLKKATGEYVAFVDCGDRLLPDALRGLLAAAHASRADITAAATRLRLGPFTREYHLPRSAAQGTDACDSPATAFRALLSGKLLASMWCNLYRRDFLTKTAPQPIDARIAEDFYFNVSVFPKATKISLTDHPLYEWRWSGMGRKYYIDGFDDLLRAYGAVADGINGTEDMRMLSVNLLDRLREACAERLNCGISAAKVRDFAAATLSLPIFRKALEAAGSYRAMPSGSISVEVMTRFSKEHLQRHRKFYIFTRILNLF